MSKNLFLKTQSKGPSKFIQNIADMKLNFQFGQPVDFGEVTKDFHSVFENMAALERERWIFLA